LEAQSQLVPGTLPRLRFGTEYFLRIRTVDLAGNSVPLEAQSEDPSLTSIRSFKYFRYEPVASPVVLTGTSIRDGESIEHVAVRSNYDLNPSEYLDRYTPPDGVGSPYSQRYFIVSKNSQLMAETHGRFDSAFGNKPQRAQDLYNLITGKEGILEKGEDGKEKIYPKMSDISLVYLPDPAAGGVTLVPAKGYDKTHSQLFTPRMFSFFDDSEASHNDTKGKNLNEDNWYDAQPVGLLLQEGKYKADWDASNRTLKVSLPKGERVRLRFSSFWHREILENTAAMWQLLKDAKNVNMRSMNLLVFSGQH